MHDKIKRATRRFHESRIKRKLVTLLKYKSEDSTKADISPQHVGALAHSHGYDADFNLHGSPKIHPTGKHIPTIQEKRQSQLIIPELLVDTI